MKRVPTFCIVGPGDSPVVCLATLCSAETSSLGVIFEDLYPFGTVKVLQLEPILERMRIVFAIWLG